MKRQPTEWEKIFANDVTNKGLVFKTYKQLWHVAEYQKRQPNQKMGRRPTYPFFFSNEEKAVIKSLTYRDLRSWLIAHSVLRSETDERFTKFLLDLLK